MAMWPWYFSSNNMFAKSILSSNSILKVRRTRQCPQNSKELSKTKVSLKLKFCHFLAKRSILLLEHRRLRTWYLTIEGIRAYEDVIVSHWLQEGNHIFGLSSRLYSQKVIKIYATICTENRDYCWHWHVYISQAK